MDLQLDGKIAFVSGSSGGIGFAIAEALAREGALVTINGRNPEELEQAQKRSKFKMQAMVADMGTPEGVNKIANILKEVDILVNNIGIYAPKDFFALTDEDWQHYFDVNVMSGVRLTRHYLKAMLEKNSGRIVFISSESAVMIPKEMIAYGVSKAAQVAVARGAAEKCEGSNVTVNTVLAGPTWTPSVEKFIKELASENNSNFEELKSQFFEKARPGSLIKRFIDPQEIANLVVYLCSPLSSATNGAAVHAEGGLIKSIL